MNIKFFAPRWGNTQNWNDFLLRAKRDGYDGAEVNIHADATPQQLDAMWNDAVRHDMQLIAQHSKTNDADFNLHADNYSKWFDLVAPYDWRIINTQTGKDYFSFEQNKQLVEIAAGHSKKYNVPVLHETHRNKFSFAAHITREYLQSIPGLTLTLDISHWVTVAESFLQDQQEAVDLALARTGHLHARVGYTQGPQVPDPRIPEWEVALNHHLGWWDKVIVNKKAEGAAEFTICPEFGSFPCMFHLPATGQPVVDQWELNLFIMELLSERYPS
ncbi:MAG: sugar phosphate isomerase/epimerase [Mucilaginibacter sp.]